MGKPCSKPPDNSARYLQYPRGYAPLLREELEELVRKRDAGDVLAVGEIAAHSLRLVGSFVRRNPWAYSTNEQLDDLIQEGYFALRNAARLYDPSKGEFSTYAERFIKRELIEYLAQDRVIKLPKRSYKEIKELSEDPNINPAKKERFKKLLTAERISHPNLSRLEIEEEDTSEEDNKKAVIEVCLEAVETLIDRYKKVIYQRFGLYGNPERTLEEIGIELKVTRERVRQIQKKAIRKIRKKMSRTIRELSE